MNIQKSTALWMTLAALVFYFLGYVVFGRDASRIVVNAGVIGCAVTIVITWFDNAVRAFRSGVTTGADNIMITVWGTWASILLYFGWVLTFQLIGMPDSWRSSPAGGTFSTLFMIMGMYAILTPINTGLAIPRPRLKVWWIGVVCGSATFGFLIAAAIFGVIKLGS
jgi:hypothetical protein